MSIEFAKYGRGYAAVVRTVGTSNRRSSVVRKECVMEGGIALCPRAYRPRVAKYKGALRGSSTP